MSRFVAPQLNLLPLSHGDTLTVKRRLNRGEQAEMFARMRADGAIDRDREWVLAYLIDWSLVDDAGALVPYRDLDLAGRAQMLGNLDPDDFKEIRDAIEQHVTAVTAVREAEKKNPEWRERIVSDLTLARWCGWRYEWLDQLDPDVYDLLVAEFNRAHAGAE